MSIRNVFIINPAAGIKNRVPELVQSIKELFSRLKKECEILVTRRPGEATEMVHRLAQEHPQDSLHVFACGGDGTFNEVAQGAVDRNNVAVTPYPVGSGNDFVRSFREYRQEDFLDLERMVNGEEKPIDVLTVDDRISVNVASVGLDAVTAKLMPSIRRFPLIGGRFSYVIALACAFFTATKNRLSFVVDGKPLDYGKPTCILATMANGKYYGGGFQTAPKAKMDDGLLDFLCVPSISRFKFLRLVGIYKKGEHLEKIPFLSFCRCHSVQICSEQPIPVNLDGEIYQMKDPLICLKEKALKILLPAVKA